MTLRRSVTVLVTLFPKFRKTEQEAPHGNHSEAVSLQAMEPVVEEVQVEDVLVGLDLPLDLSVRMEGTRRKLHSSAVIMATPERIPKNLIGTRYDLARAKKPMAAVTVVMVMAGPTLDKAIVTASGASTPARLCFL